MIWIKEPVVINPGKTPSLYVRRVFFVQIERAEISSMVCLTTLLAINSITTNRSPSGSLHVSCRGSQCDAL